MWRSAERWEIAKHINGDRKKNLTWSLLNIAADKMSVPYRKTLHAIDSISIVQFTSIYIHCCFLQQFICTEDNSIVFLWFNFQLNQVCDLTHTTEIYGLSLHLLRWVAIFVSFSCSFPTFTWRLSFILFVPNFPSSTDLVRCPQSFSSAHIRS